MIQICKDAANVFDSEYIQSVSRGLLRIVLKITHVLSPGSTKKAFDACMDWAKRSCLYANIDPSVLLNRRTQLGDCLELIQFGAMTRAEIKKCVREFRDLFTAQEFEHFFIMMGSKNSKPLTGDKMIRYEIDETITYKMMKRASKQNFISIHKR